jgi:hypothetical protein
MNTLNQSPTKVKTRFRDHTSLYNSSDTPAHADRKNDPQTSYKPSHRPQVCAFLFQEKKHTIANNEVEEVKYEETQSSGMRPWS